MEHTYHDLDRPSSSSGTRITAGLESWHTFSFADYQLPRRTCAFAPRVSLRIA